MNEEIKNELAKSLQRQVPLVSRPFAAAGEPLGLSEKEVIDQVLLWREQKVLREISAIMEGELLGYEAALVCGKVPLERLYEVAEIISSHPTVTHNYERNHNFNLWFTISVPREMGLNQSLRILENITGIDNYHPLRRTLTFKVGVVFDLNSLSNDTAFKEGGAPCENLVITEETKQIVLALQQDLPTVAHPFRALAERNGFSEESLLNFANIHLGKAVRKYVATFLHRKLGVKFNAMTVWNIPSADLKDKGLKLAANPQVSHCYGRTTIPDFPYSLYAMVHGPTDEHVQQVVSDIAEKIDCRDYLVLYSPTEFKKCRLRYFLPQLDDWWNKNAAHLL